MAAFIVLDPQAPRSTVQNEPVDLFHHFLWFMKIAMHEYLTSILRMQGNANIEFGPHVADGISHGDTGGATLPCAAGKIA
jgi:hypothetical protein